MPEPAASYVTPTPGVVLAGRYRVEEALGHGGMAEVFKALDLTSGRSVAVKVLRGNTEQSPEATARLRREGQVLRALKNPAIVGIEEVSELDGGRVMLVMELLRGETLGARMRRGRIEPSELAPIVAGTAAGLSAAHANGVVHRDLKPDNIFLCQGQDGRVQVKLLDFGVSKVFGGERLTATGQVLGTPRYMSPEQLGSEPDVDHRVDVYSLGVIIYEALAGKPPFLAGTPTDLIVAILHGKIAPLRSLRPDLPAAIEGVVMRAMARVRDARFRAATELADAFFDACGISPSQKEKPRAGMATTPLGSLRTLDPALQAAAPAPSPAPALPAPAASTPKDALSPGTFSELPQFDEAKIRADAAASVHATAPAGGDGRAPASGAPAWAAQTALAPSASGPPVNPLAVTAPPDARAPGATGPAVAPAPSTRDIPKTAISMIDPVPASAFDPMGAPPSAATKMGGTSPLAPVPRNPAPMGGSMMGGSMMGGSAVGAPPPGAMGGAMPGSTMGAPMGAVAAPLEPTVSPGRSRLALALVGLTAGAISAGLVIAALSWLTSRHTVEAAPPPPPPATSTAEVADAGAASTDAAQTAVATADPTPPPSSGTPETATHEGEGDPTPPPSGARHHTHHTTASADPTPPSSGTTHEHTTPPPDPRTDPLGAAQRALSDGSAAECVEILSGLLGGGGTPIALRRRADCLMRLGRRDEAIADYQRFCRLAPDHPAIPEVREILEGMGRTCP
jgi:serine/threonine-protein kinase